MHPNNELPDDELEPELEDLPSEQAEDDREEQGRAPDLGELDEDPSELGS